MLCGDSMPISHVWITTLVVEGIQHPNDDLAIDMMVVMARPSLTSISFRRVNFINLVLPLEDFENNPLPRNPNLQHLILDQGRSTSATRVHYMRICFQYRESLHSLYIQGLTDEVIRSEVYFGGWIATFLLEFPNVTTLVFHFNTTHDIFFQRILLALPLLTSLDLYNSSRGATRANFVISNIQPDWRFRLQQLRIYVRDLTPRMNALIRDHFRELESLTITKMGPLEEFTASMQALNTIHRPEPGSGNNMQVQRLTIEENRAVNRYMTPLVDTYAGIRTLHLRKCFISGNQLDTGIWLLDHFILDIAFMFEANFLERAGNVGRMLQVDTNQHRAALFYLYNGQQFVRVGNPLQNHYILRITCFILRHLRLYNSADSRFISKTLDIDMNL